MYYHTSDWHLDHDNIIKFDNRPDGSIDEMNERIIATTNRYVGENDVLVYHGDFLLNKKIDRDDTDRYADRIRFFLDQLRCKNIIFVCGNHDTTWVRSRGERRPNWKFWDLFKIFQCIRCNVCYDVGRRFGLPARCECPKPTEYPVYNIHPMGYELVLTRKICSEHKIPDKFEGRLITCTHYSHRTWNKSHKHEQGMEVGRAINLYGHSHGSLAGIRNSFDVGFNVWNRPLSLVEILTDIMPKHNQTEQGKIFYGHHE